MRLIEINWKPDDRQLRQFGLIAFFALPLLGWFFTSQTSIVAWLIRSRPLMWDPGNLTAIAILGMIGTVMGVMGCWRPQSLRLIFLVVSLAAIPIGMVIGELVVAMIYFGVFMPVALLFRLVGRDALQREFDPSATSYWQPKAQFADVRRYYRQS